MLQGQTRSVNVCHTVVYMKSLKQKRRKHSFSCKLALLHCFSHIFILCACSLFWHAFSSYTSTSAARKCQKVKNLLRMKWNHKYRYTYIQDYRKSFCCFFVFLCFPPHIIAWPSSPDSLWPCRNPRLERSEQLSWSAWRRQINSLDENDWA